jgi:hypothetical protein
VLTTRQQRLILEYRIRKKINKLVAFVKVSARDVPPLVVGVSYLTIFEVQNELFMLQGFLARGNFERLPSYE